MDIINRLLDRTSRKNTFSDPRAWLGVPTGVALEAGASRGTLPARCPMLPAPSSGPGARACVRGEGGEPKIPTALAAGVGGGACEAKGGVSSKGG